MDGAILKSDMGSNPIEKSFGYFNGGSILLSARFLPIIVSMSRYLKFLPICLLFFIANSVIAEEPETPASPETAASGSTSTTPTIPRTEPDIDQNIISNLSKLESPDTEFLQLDTSKNGEKLFAVYQAESSGALQGGIIMFPDDKTHFDWPGDLNYLRTGLTEYGWHTLAIYLPQIEAPAIPKRTLPVLKSIQTSTPSEGDTAVENTTEEAPANQNAEAPNTPTEEPAAQSSEASTTEPQEPYHEQAIRRAQAALNYLQQQETERFIVLGIGTGAIWAAQYVQQFQESQDLRLVMIDAQQPQSESTPDLLKILPEIKTTILDFHHNSRMNTADRNPISPERRLKVARQKALTNFHQSRLPATRDDWKKGNPWLVKHVRGVINTYVINAEKMPRMQDKDMNSTSDEQGPGAMRK
jgi:hypothetical protein